MYTIKTEQLYSASRTTTNSQLPLQTIAWPRWQQWLLRVCVIFFLLLLVPLEAKWYERLFEATYFYEVLSPFTSYRANFIEIKSASGRWGFLSYSNWFFALGIALAGGSLWTLIQRKTLVNYDKLYYWLRVLIRYRIAIGIIDFGYLKLFPMQMPYPSIANLNTNFGDYTLYKLYWQSVGIVTWYEIVLGAVEVLGGFLLFFRQTASLGAVINIGVLFNIAYANHAYDGGVHVYSAFFVLLSLFVLAYDIPALYRLLIKEEDVLPSYYHPSEDPAFRKSWWLTSKVLFIFLFVFLLGYYRYDRHYNRQRLKDPVEQGIPAATGFYKIRSFKVNGQAIDPTSSDAAWQEATFERWSTFAVRTRQTQPIPLENGTPQEKDIDRSYELAGVAGGWKYYYYQADTLHKALKLWNKAAYSLSKANKQKTVQFLNNPLTWKYEQTHPNEINITGKDEDGNDLDVLLQRVQRNYPLLDGGTYP